MEELLKEIDRLKSEIDELLHQVHVNIDKLYDHYNNKIHSVDRIKNLIEISKTLAPQRTAEWYKRRGACITASDINAVLGKDKYKSPRKVLMQKCVPEKPWSNQFTRWGNKYEPIATLIYEYEYNVKVYDAPLLIHPLYPFLGASCDGFVIDEKNNEGYLIEIKCPARREPNDDVPANYTEQPRTQMAVTKVDKCVFYQCKFEEFYSLDIFKAKTSKDDIRGILFEYSNSDDDDKFKRYYIYPTIEHIQNSDPDEMVEYLLNEWNKLEQDNSKLSGEKFVYWTLAKKGYAEMYREPDWLHSNLPRFKHFWNLIEHYREHGVENMPRKI